MLPITKDVLETKLSAYIKDNIISSNSRILFIDDGSTDSTWSLIEKYHSENSIFSGIQLSRNFGHQNAILAGLLESKSRCDVSITIDADLQDDVDAIDDMIKKYQEGNDIVFGVRSKRNSDSFLKKITAKSYYFLMQSLGAKIIPEHADFRLMSKRSLDALASYSEANIFLRGIVPSLGFKSDKVFYERKEREAGKSKYSILKMFKLAMDGLTSFSGFPLYLIFVFGIVLFSISIICMFFLLISSLHSHNWNISLWIIPSLFLSCSFILLSIGIIGIYLGNTYLETKHRPKYFISEKLF